MIDERMSLFAGVCQQNPGPLCATVTNRLLDSELGHFQESGEWLKRVGKKASQSSGLLTKLA